MVFCYSCSFKSNIDLAHIKGGAGALKWEMKWKLSSGNKICLGLVVVKGSAELHGAE